MNKSPWLQALANGALGREPKLREHVVLLLLALPLYAVNIAVLLHAVHLGYLSQDASEKLIAGGVAIVLTFYTLVRSGWSQRWADPVLTFPHAVALLVLCMGAYMSLGQHRLDTMILLAQILVLSMFRLRPIHVLLLGLLAAGMLATCIVLLNADDPVSYPSTKGWTEFAIAGPALLTLSVIGKWISDIRVRIAAQATELESAIATVRQMATNDMLTGVFNRRVMTELAEAELKFIERTDAPLCMALIDIDHFKHINDRHGHQVGDIVLKGLAQHAQSQLRHIDKLARWGGEEFLLMLPRISLPDAMAAVERLREGVDNLSYPERPDVHVTFSAGVAQAKPGESLEHLIERADDALYEAKRQGRNRSVVALNDVKPVDATAQSGKEVMH